MRSAIILAAGKGTRMKSTQNKVMHEVLNKPMISHVCDLLKECGVEEIITVVGHQAEAIQNHLQDSVKYVEQKEQLGTGHAIMQAVPLLKDDASDVLIICGDTPLFTKATIESMFEANQNATMSVLTAILDSGKSYGRIVRDANNQVNKIVEAKDASADQLLINEINTGLYCFKGAALKKHIFEITNDNAQQEYYLTDLIEIFNKSDLIVNGVVVEDFNEALGVNDRKDLATANRIMKERVNNEHLLNGVSIQDPNNTYIGTDVKIGMDTIIEPNVIIKGNVTIGENCLITSGTSLINCVIGNNVTIESSKIIDSTVGNNVVVGPFAHFRAKTNVSDNCRVGNFVEFKNNQFGEGSKCAHLTYLGDSTFGKKVNVGCGVVTVNYDGKNKFKTIVEDGAFIGSNVNLIAPVKVGANALCAAGSTITGDINDGDMGIARSRQVNKSGFGEKYKNK